MAKKRKEKIDTKKRQIEYREINLLDTLKNIQNRGTMRYKKLKKKLPLSLTSLLCTYSYT